MKAVARWDLCSSSASPAAQGRGKEVAPGSLSPGMKEKRKGLEEERQSRLKTQFGPSLAPS